MYGAVREQLKGTLSMYEHYELGHHCPRNKKKRVSIICVANTASRLGKRKKEKKAAKRKYNWTNRAYVNGDDRSTDLFLSEKNCPTRETTILF